ncbi:Pentatricopeptide repeat-containing protein [Drosera capensis]
MTVRRNKSFYRLMRGLIRDSKFAQIEPILTTHVKKNGVVGGAIGKILVGYLCMKNSVGSALKVMKKFREQNMYVVFPVDVLGVLVGRGAVLDAYRLVIGARDGLPAMDVVDYVTVIHGLCKGGYVDRALGLCVFAMKKGVEINVIVYNVILNGLCREGCLVEAFRVFDSLEKVGIVASDFTYGTLIDGLVREGFLLDAREMFERMMAKGVKCNSHVYGSLVEGYSRFGYVEEGLRLVREMEDGCGEPGGFIMSAVMYGFCREGDLEKALHFFDHMKGKGRFPDFLGFLHLIRGLCAKGRMEEARSITREMLQSDSVVELINRVDLEIETDSVGVLSHLCDQGSIHKAVEILTEIGNIFFPYRRILPKFSKRQSILCVETVNKRALQPVSFFKDIGFRDNGEQIVENCSSQGILESQIPDFDAFYSQLESLCSEGHLQEAEWTVRSRSKMWMRNMFLAAFIYHFLQQVLALSIFPNMSWWRQYMLLHSVIRKRKDSGTVVLLFNSDTHALLFLTISSLQIDDAVEEDVARALETQSVAKYAVICQIEVRVRFKILRVRICQIEVRTQHAEKSWRTTHPFCLGLVEVESRANILEETVSWLIFFLLAVQ